MRLRLSQTPIRTLVGIKVPPSTSSLTFTPTIGPHVSRFQPVSASTYRLVTSSSPPTNHSPLPSQAFAPRPDLLSYPSTTSAISDFSLPPSHQQPSATSPAPLTPSSEKSSDSFFTVRENSPTPSPPCRSPGPSRVSISRSFSRTHDDSRIASGFDSNFNGDCCGR